MNSQEKVIVQSTCGDTFSALQREVPVIALTSDRPYDIVAITANFLRCDCPAVQIINGAGYNTVFEFILKTLNELSVGNEKFHCEKKGRIAIFKLLK